MNGSEAFGAIVGDVDGALYIVTTAAGGERAGCLVGFSTQCSVKPPRFGVWLSKLNRTYRVAQDATTLVAHLLREGDRDLAACFGGETSDDVDKFVSVDWSPGPDGCPVISRLDWFAGSVVDRLDTGDHVAFVMAPTEGSCRRHGVRQLRYREIADVHAGHPIADR